MVLSLRATHGAADGEDRLLPHAAWSPRWLPMGPAITTRLAKHSHLGRGRSQGTTQLVSSSQLSLQTGLFFYLCFHVLYFCERVTSQKRGLLLKYSEVTVRSFSLRAGSLCGHSSHKYVFSVYSLLSTLWYSVPVCSRAVASGRPSL